MTAANIGREVVVNGLPETMPPHFRGPRNGDRLSIVGYRRAFRSDALLVNLAVDGSDRSRFHLPAMYVELVLTPKPVSSWQALRDSAMSGEDLCKRAAEAKRAVTEKAADDYRADMLARAHNRLAAAHHEVADAQRALAAIEARPF
jgi:hypothetical protein